MCGSTNRPAHGTPEILKREIKALAFNQYGTIVDMQKGLTVAVTPFLEEKGLGGSPNSFVTWWRRTHFENSMIDALLDRGHTPYSADRAPRGVERNGSLRYRLQQDEVQLTGRRDRDARSLSPM